MPEGLFTLTQAIDNFSAVAEWVDNNGKAIITKHSKPKFVLLDLDCPDYILDLSEDERIDIVCKRVLSHYLEAFKMLADS